MKWRPAFITFPVIIFGLLQACGFMVQDRYENAKTQVFVKNDDIRYHLETCRYVTEKSQQVDLVYAVHLNRTPCPVCRPPLLIEAEPNPTRDLIFVAIGAALLLTLIALIPVVVRLGRRRKAIQALSCQAMDEWNNLDKAEQERRIAEAMKNIRNPNRGVPTSSEKMRY